MHTYPSPYRHASVNKSLMILRMIIGISETEHTHTLDARSQTSAWKKPSHREEMCTFLRVTPTCACVCRMSMRVWCVRVSMHVLCVVCIHARMHVSLACMYVCVTYMHVSVSVCSCVCMRNVCMYVCVCGCMCA